MAESVYATASDKYVAKWYMETFLLQITIWIWIFLATLVQLFYIPYNWRIGCLVFLGTFCTLNDIVGIFGKIYKYCLEKLDSSPIRW